MAALLEDNKGLAATLSAVQTLNDGVVKILKVKVRCQFNHKISRTHEDVATCRYNSANHDAPKYMASVFIARVGHKSPESLRLSVHIC